MKNNQIGSSLVQVMLAAAIATGSGYLLMKNQDIASRFQSKKAYNQDVQAVIDQLQTVLARAKNCTATISQNPITSIKQGEAAPSPGFLNYFNIIPGNDLFKTDVIIGNSGVMIKNFEKVKVGADDFLRVRFTVKKGKQMSGTADLMHDFKLTYYSNIDGTQAGCYSEAREEVQRTVASTCDGQYDNVTKKCRLDSIPECTIVPEGQCSNDVWKCVGKVAYQRPDDSIFYMDKCCRKTIPHDGSADSCVAP